MKGNLILQNPESINDELFKSFDPEEELWLIGGSYKQTVNASITYSPGGVDADMLYDVQF